MDAEHPRRGTGASIKELMVRMGHASPRAALIYQHATHERDQAIAQALSDLIARSSPPSAARIAKLLPRASPTERP